MTVMTDSNMCFSMKVDMPTTWQNWSKSSMKLYEIDRHYPTSSHKHTGTVSPHLWKTHLFSICWCLWLKCSSCGLKTQLCGTETNISSWPRCRHLSPLARAAWRRLDAPESPQDLKCLDAIGVYNGCIIIINNHNMIIWIIWFYVAVYDCIL